MKGAAYSTATAIPAHLRKLNRWVVWRLERRDGKSKKAPYAAASPTTRASTTSPETWGSYEAASAAAEAGDVDGVGFVFTDTPYAGIDFDNCVEDGTLNEHVERLTNLLNSYTEYSPSGAGVHTIVAATLNGGRKKTADTPWRGSFETYDTDRFFAMTGHRVPGTPELVEDRQAQLDCVRNELLPDRPGAQLTPPRVSSTTTTDDELLERARTAKNGAELDRLMRGDTSGHHDDHSAADLALCRILAFWTGQDPNRIDRIYRQSGLMRDKWDSARGDSTYGRTTIELALAGCSAFYEWDGPTSGDARGGTPEDAAGLNGAGNGALGEVMLARELAELATHSQESSADREVAVYNCATRLGRLLASDDGLDLSSTWQALSAAGERLGLPEADPHRNIQRGLAEGMAQPRDHSGNGNGPKGSEDTHETARDSNNGNGSKASEDPNGAAPGVAADDGWASLPTSALPAFPLEALPDHLAAFVQALATETQTPPDLAALAALCVLSAAALGGVMVDCGTWEEELALYVLAVMRSGDRKSSVLKKALAPLLDIEEEWREQAKGPIRELRTRLETLQTRRAKLIKKVGELDHADEQYQEAEEQLAKVSEEIEQIGEPVMPRLFADDATPEALVGLISQHGRIAILSAEAAVADNLIGRYDANGAANLHLACKAYTGEFMRSDRRKREPEDLKRPLMTMGLIVQDHVLPRLVGNVVARGQGLAGRFAYAMPQTLQGHRQVDAPSIAPELLKSWDSTVRRVNSCNPLTKPTQLGFVGFVSTPGSEILRLSLSFQAKTRLTALQERLEPRLADGGDLAPVSDWIARYHGLVARLAGLLHLAQYGLEPSAIDDVTMRQALKIGEYFFAHGLAALSAPDKVERHTLLWIERHHKPTVSRRDLYRGPLNGRGTAEQAQKLAQRMIELGASARRRTSSHQALPAAGREARATRSTRGSVIDDGRGAEQRRPLVIGGGADQDERRRWFTVGGGRARSRRPPPPP